MGTADVLTVLALLLSWLLASSGWPVGPAGARGEVYKAALPAAWPLVGGDGPPVGPRGMISPQGAHLTMDLSRLSACSYPLRRQPLDDALRVIAAAGFGKVDLLGVDGHFPPEAAPPAVAIVGEAARRHGVRIANLGTYYGRSLPGTAAEAAREEGDARRAMAAAVQLGARSLRIHPGKDRSHETGFALVPFFRRVAEEATRQGLWLGIETHGGLSSDAPAMMELCREVGWPAFGVLFDPSNCAANGVDYKAAWEVFHERVVHVHLKDGRTGADGKWQRVHLGDGEIDVPWLLGELDRAGYQGDIALEYEVNELEPPETGLARWRAYCETLAAG
jgi:sugar phosphate isomerase/epimerase